MNDSFLNNQTFSRFNENNQDFNDFSEDYYPEEPTNYNRDRWDMDEKYDYSSEDERQCSHCHKRGHTREHCWDLHGKPNKHLKRPPEAKPASEAPPRQNPRPKREAQKTIFKSRGTKTNKKTKLVADDLYREENRLQGAFDALVEQEQIRNGPPPLGGHPPEPPKAPPKPLDLFDPKWKADPTGYDTSWFEPWRMWYNMYGLIPARTRNRLKYVNDAVAQIPVHDVRADVITGAKVKYPDAGLNWFQSSKRFEVWLPFFGWVRPSSCKLAKLLPRWASYRRKTFFLASTEYVSQITTHNNVSPLFDDTTCFERLNNSAKSLTSVNLDRHEVWLNSFVSQSSAYIAYHMFKVMKYDMRDLDFPGAPAIRGTPLWSRMVTVLAKLICLALVLLSMMCILSYLGLVIRCVVRPLRVLLDVMYKVWLYPTQTSTITLPSSPEYVNVSPQNPPSRIPISGLVSDYSSLSGSQRILHPLKLMLTVLSKRGSQRPHTLLGVNHNYSITTGSSVEVSSSQTGPLIDIAPLSLSLKTNVTTTLSMPEQLIRVVTNLSAPLVQFFVLLRKGFLLLSGSLKWFLSDCALPLFAILKNLVLSMFRLTMKVMKHISTLKRWLTVSLSCMNTWFRSCLRAGSLCGVAVRSLAVRTTVNLGTLLLYVKRYE